MYRSIRPFAFLFGLCLVALPGLAIAQQPGQMDPAEMMRHFQDPAAMQRMAQEAQAAQRCMKEIDQKKVDALQKRAEAASREIDQLCKAGKKDEAKARALALSQEFRSDATLKKLQECTKGMAEMIKGMPWAQLPGMQDDPDPSKDEVCS